MSFFAKLERLCAALIERSFAKTFPSDLDPAQVARKLVSTMEAQTRDDEGRLCAPGSYVVYVNPTDFERLAEHREYLQRAWADLLRNLARKVGVRFEAAKVSVIMTARDSIPIGAVEIAVAQARQEPKSVRLCTIEGLPPDGVYRLAGRARIGRSDESEIVLLDPGVSRSHAVVEIAAGEPVVVDLDSTNGTYVNGRRIKRETLRDGDELRLGNTRLRVEIQ